MESAAPQERRKSLFVMVGDPSSDRNVSRMIPELKKANPDLHVWGCGGPRMAAEGVEILHNCDDFTTIGVVEILKRAKFFIALQKELVEKITERNPAAVLLVDMGTFNLKLSTVLRKKFPNLPILYFTSPQVWGSRPWRIRTVKQNITKMLVIFPFEVAIYRKHAVPVRFMGHPLLKNIPAREAMPSKEEFCAKYKIDPQKPIIAVFAGSRRREVGKFAPIILDAIKTLLAVRNDLQFAFSTANDSLLENTRSEIQTRNMKDLIDQNLFLISHDDNLNLISASDFVWAKSGTTTLEVTLFGKPMLLFYKVTWAEYALYFVLKTLNFIGMPNILAGERVVPELLQLDCRAEQLVKYTNDLMNVPGMRADVSQKLIQLRDQLGQGDYAVNLVEEIMAVI
ncbi:MAG: lipid-A-disaccharide synthase [Cyanobacteria bacterium SZAS-4]|nr:lipid-A-disaccharide synthase [Cyanobacteria bacterium SZAS-4]